MLTILRLFFFFKTYDIPECESDEDEDFKRQNEQLKEAIPFAVCGANQIIEVRGKKVRGRMYPWGVVEVENPVMVYPWALGRYRSRKFDCVCFSFHDIIII